VNGLELMKTIKAKAKAYKRTEKEILSLTKINSVAFPVEEDFAN
jgi:hypothetical protein